MKQSSLGIYEIKEVKSFVSWLALRRKKAMYYFLPFCLELF